MHLRPVILSHRLVVFNTHPQSAPELGRPNKADCSPLVEILLRSFYFTPRADSNIDLRKRLCRLLLLFLFLREPPDLVALLVRQNRVCVDKLLFA